MIRYLSAQEILFIHSRLIATTGGEHGIRDLSLLESAVARPMATFDGRDLYPDIFTKAAALMSSLAQNHPFVDGNKRTAITSSAMFLRRNNLSLEVDNPSLTQFTFDVVNKKPPLDQIATWFEANTTTIG
ncbi:MAG: type II toxin-antitoxin system death-on-curing family toxin [Chloroflexota bacterium]